MSDGSRFEGVGASNRGGGGKPQGVFPVEESHEREPSPALLWVTVPEAAWMTGVSITTLHQAALDGRLRHTTGERLGKCGPGMRERTVRLVHIEDVRQFKIKAFVSAAYSGPPTEETLDRLMDVIGQVKRGETWPVQRKEAAMVWDDYTEDVG